MNNEAADHPAHLCSLISGIVICFRRSIIWASTRENLLRGVCEQQRHIPACAPAQPDQLCIPLAYMVDGIIAMHALAYTVDGMIAMQLIP